MSYLAACEWPMPITAIYASDSSLLQSHNGSSYRLSVNTLRWWVILVHGAWSVSTIENQHALPRISETMWSRGDMPVILICPVWMLDFRSFATLGNHVYGFHYWFAFSFDWIHSCYVNSNWCMKSIWGVIFIFQAVRRTFPELKQANCL